MLVQQYVGPCSCSQCVVNFGLEIYWFIVIAHNHLKELSEMSDMDA